MLVVVCLLCILSYSLFISLAIKGWNQLKPIAKNNCDEDLNVSIVVPCRNEAANIDLLFSSLEKQSYDKEKFEVVFVDDHSDDSTSAKILELQKQYGFSSRMISLNSSTGKKAALSLGIEKSKYNYILTTDADCILPPDWIRRFADYFIFKDAVLVAGPVFIVAEDSFFSQMQSFEFSILSAVTASSFGLGKPIMSNGASMGFKKTLYNEVGGYLNHINVPSGDDVLFLHEAKEKSKKLFFVFDPSAIVTTSAKDNFMEFVKQRVRWAGKSIYYKDKETIVVASLIFVYNFLLILFLMLGLIISNYFYHFLLLFIAKWVCDLAFINAIRHFYQLKNIFFQSIVLSLFYPFYTVGIGLISLVAPAKWKW